MHAISLRMDKHRFTHLAFIFVFATKTSLAKQVKYVPVDVSIARCWEYVVLSTIHTSSVSMCSASLEPQGFKAAFTYDSLSRECKAVDLGGTTETFRECAIEPQEPSILVLMDYQYIQPGRSKSIY